MKYMARLLKLSWKSPNLDSSLLGEKQFNSVCSKYNKWFKRGSVLLSFMLFISSSASILSKNYTLSTARYICVCNGFFISVLQTLGQKEMMGKHLWAISLGGHERLWRLMCPFTQTKHPLPAIQSRLTQLWVKPKHTGFRVTEDHHASRMSMMNNSGWTMILYTSLL